MPIDEDEFEKVGRALEKKWEMKAMVRRGSHMPKVRRIPSGSWSFDAMSGGGPPVRRWSRFVGGEMSSKSLMAWNVAKNAQNIHIYAEVDLAKRIEEVKDLGDKELLIELKEQREDILKTWPDGMIVCYYNVEQTFDPVFVENAGIDIDELRLIDATVIEQVGESLENMLSVGVDLHIIDSCASAVSLAELNMDITEQRRGTGAKQWALMLRRAKTRFKPNHMGIIIDQVRINQQTGSEEAPGGKYLAHASDLSVHFRRGKWLYHDKHGVLRDNDEAETMSGMKEADGMEITTRVTKSRVCRPFRTARIRLDFDGMEIDDAYEIKEAAIHYGLVKKSAKGGWYTFPNGEKAQGEAAARDAIANDPQLRHDILTTWQQHAAM